jgi:hypothetical protein
LKPQRVFDPFRFLLIAVSGWMNQRLLQVIDYLHEENRMLREQLVEGPNAPAVTGKDRIRASVKPLFDDPGFTMKYEITKVEVAQSGELGYTQGTYASGSTDTAAKRVVADRGKWLTVRRSKPMVTGR